MNVMNAWQLLVNTTVQSNKTPRAIPFAVNKFPQKYPACRHGYDPFESDGEPGASAALSTSM